MAEFLHDESGKLIGPDIYLQKRNTDEIGLLRYDNLTGTESSNDLNTVSFEIYRNIDGEPNQWYDLVSDMQLCYIPGHGHYSLTVSVESDGVVEKKIVTGTAWECELGKLYLQDFQANTAEEGDPVDENGDFIQTIFYSEDEPERSLLHRVLRDTNWTIHRAKDTQAYLDMSSKVRVYDISWQDKYSFLKDLQNELDVVFVFDKEERKITWYLLDDYGNDTGVFITFSNLAESIQVNSDESKLVTELVIHGGEGIDVDQVIPAATNSLFKPDYFLTESYMSKDTIDAYSYYMEYYTQAKIDYVNYMKSADSWNQKLLEYQTAKPLSSVEGEGTKEGTLKGLDEMTEAELRENFAWKDGAEYNYGYNHLETIKETYEEVKAARDEAGNTDDPKYEQILLIIDLVEEYMGILEPLIENASDKISEASNAAATIKTNCDLRVQFSKYFSNELGLAEAELTSQTEKSVQEINSFRITDEYTNDNYIATENESYDYDSILEHTQELLERGESELNKHCIPYITWACTLQNLLKIPEFLPLLKQKTLNAGDFIYVELHEGLSVRVRIVTISYDYSETGEISFEFADRINNETVIDDISEMIGQAGSVASSMQYYTKQMDKIEDAYKEVTEILTGGLDASKINIYNNPNQEVITDTYGILARKMLSDKIYSPEQLRIQSGQIVFTEDDWNTVSTALGKITLETSEGLTSTYGLIAKAVLAGYIQGSEIVGGKIFSENYEAGTKGTLVNLNDGTFEFAGGKLTFDGTNLEIQGEINADSGTIGGFNIGGSYLASGTTSLAGADSSVYVGTDGISCGTAFKVTDEGHFELGGGKLVFDGNDLILEGLIDADYGFIGGFDVGETYLANGTSSLLGNDNSVYLGTDGISCGKGVSITPNGNINSYNGRNKTTIQSGRINFYNSEGVSIGGFFPMGIPNDSGDYEYVSAGLCCLKDGRSAGVYVQTDSGNYSIRYLANNGDNPNGHTENNIFFGTEWHGGKVTFDSTVQFNGYINFDTSAHIYSDANQHIYFAASNELNFYLFYGVLYEADAIWTLSPYINGNISLGSPNKRWGQIYSTSSTIITSDQNEKNSIRSLDPCISEKIIRGIQPKSFKYDSGTSGRTHYGMISQDIELLLSELGIDSKEFAAFVKYRKYKSIEKEREIVSKDGITSTQKYIEEQAIKDENGNPVYGYGLRYEEFVAPMIQCIQQLYDRIEQLESKLFTN